MRRPAAVHIAFAGILSALLSVASSTAIAQQLNGRHYSNAYYGFEFDIPKGPAVDYTICPEGTWNDGKELGFVIAGGTSVCERGERPMIVIRASFNWWFIKDNDAEQEASCAAILEFVNGFDSARRMASPGDFRIAVMPARVCAIRYDDGDIDLHVDVTAAGINSALRPAAEQSRQIIYGGQLRTTVQRLDGDLAVFRKTLASLRINRPARAMEGRQYRNIYYSFRYVIPARDGADYTVCPPNEWSAAHGTGFFLNGGPEACDRSELRPFIYVGASYNAGEQTAKEYLRCEETPPAGITPPEIVLAGRKAVVCVRGDRGKVSLSAHIARWEKRGDELPAIFYDLYLNTTRERYRDDLKVYLETVASFAFEPLDNNRGVLQAAPATR